MIIRPQSIGVPGVVVEVRLHADAQALLHAVTAAALRRGDDAVTDALGLIFRKLDGTGVFEQVETPGPILLALKPAARATFATALDLIDSRQDSPGVLRQLLELVK